MVCLSQETIVSMKLSVRDFTNFGLTCPISPERVDMQFTVGDESQGFKLLIEDYIGNAGCMSLDKN